MIVVEDVLKSIFEQIPAIDVNDYLSRSPRFSYGDKKELNAYLQLKKDDSYPLIWYLLPNKEKHFNDLTTVQTNCTLILATRETRQDLLNEQRYLLSFQHVLNPLASYVIEGLQTSGKTIIQDEYYELSKHPNYSDEDAGIQNATIDLWDAIRIDCKIEINANICLNTIKWQQRK